VVILKEINGCRKVICTSLRQALTWNNGSDQANFFPFRDVMSVDDVKITEPVASGAGILFTDSCHPNHFILNHS